MDMKAYTQDLFQHLAVRIQTLLKQQPNTRLIVLENHFTDKLDSSTTTTKAEIEALRSKSCHLENSYYAVLQETRRTHSAVTELEEISADLEDKKTKSAI